MALPVVVFGVLLVVAIATYQFLLHPVFLSPLSKIPNAHWSCSFSPIWLLWIKWTHQENRSVYKRHMESGSVIRLAPNILSVNCFEDGLKRIYQGGFPKPVFYWRGFAIYGTENIFTFEDNESHSARKRMISNTFSKSFIMSSLTARGSTRDILFGRYLPLIYRAATDDKAVEVLGLNYAYSMDTFIQWQFGRSLSSNFIEDPKERKMYLDGFFGPSGYTFWQYEFPDFANILRRVGIFLIPKWVDIGFKAIEDWNLDKCDKAQQLLASSKDLTPDDHPVVFERAIKLMSDIHSKPRTYPQRLQIASDMFAHNSAAFETSGNTETYLFWQMCCNPIWQKRLREELLTLSPLARFQVDKEYKIEDLPQPMDIDALPILHAVIAETLRLHPSVPGAQPRVAPRDCTLGGYDNIPKGTIVQSSAYSLHRTPSVFPDPQEWKPERWLDASPEELANMRKWSWAFGSGGRMCIGVNFAYYSMKFLATAVYTNFTTSIYDHGDMELLDAYLAGPKGHRLEIKFHSVDESKSGVL